MIAIIIPNWNGIDFIAECLKSLEAQSTTGQVIVVDNGSRDGSVELIKRDFPSIKLIELSKNHGFAGGVNEGIRAAMKLGAEYVALFNNDAIADKDWLRWLSEAASQHPEAGIITSKIVDIEGKKIDSTGDFYSKWGLPFPRGRGEADTDQYATPEEVFSASGGASLYQVAMISQVGFFDEDFFAYFEDVDISFRARLYGWSVRYEPRAIARHHIGGTSSKVSGLARFHSVKNLPLLYTKNMPGRLYWKYLLLLIMTMLLIGINSLRNGSFRYYIKGLFFALVLLPKITLARWKIQHKRHISSGDINKLLYQSLPPTQLNTLRALPLVGRWLFRGSKIGASLD